MDLHWLLYKADFKRKTMIKVENIQKYNILQDCNNVTGVLNRLVAPAKLVLVECELMEALILFHIDKYHLYNYKPEHEDFLLIQESHYFKPIFISESEKNVYKGEWFYNIKSRSIFKQDMFDVLELGDSEFKILALPEHFTPEHLKMIVVGDLKVGDKVNIVCENVAYDIHDHKKENLLVIIKKNSSGYETISGATYEKYELNSFYIVKLNSSNHINTHPIKENNKQFSLDDMIDFGKKLLEMERRIKELENNRLVSISLAEKAFDAGYDRALYVSGGEDTDLSGKIPLSKNEWFRENLK